MVKVRKSHMQGQSSLRDIDDWLDGLPLESARRQMEGGIRAG